MRLFSLPQKYEFQGRKATLAEHLGFKPDTRLAIIGADDFGLCEAVNSAVVELFAESLITSTSLLVPADAADDAIDAAHESEIACGVHLTFNSDFVMAPLAPVSSSDEVSSLLDEGGKLLLDVESFASRVKLDEVEREAKAQVDHAAKSGLDISHLDSHEGTLQLNEGFIELYFRLAQQYSLPLRAGSMALLQELGLDSSWLERAHGMGLHFPDNLVYIPLYAFATVAEKEAYLQSLIQQLPAGATEFYFHPAHDTEEARHLLPTSPQAQTLADPEMAWRVRVNDYELLKRGNFHKALADAGVRLMDFKLLRNLLRQ